MSQTGRLTAVAVLLLAAQFGRAHPGAEQTLSYLNAQLSINPGNAALYQQRALAHSHNGNHQLALTDLQTANRLNDGRIAALDFGLLYYRLGDSETAVNYLNRHLEEFPDHPIALRHRAKIFQAQQNNAAALRDYNTLITQGEGLDVADYLATAKLLTLSQPDRTEEAIAILDQGISRIGVVPQLQNRAIELELKRGKTDLAITRQQTLSNGNAGVKNPHWLTAMAKLLISAGRENEARQHLLEAEALLKSLRKNPARHQLLAEVHASLAELDP